MARTTLIGPWLYRHRLALLLALWGVSMFCLGCYCRRVRQPLYAELIWPSDALEQVQRYSELSAPKGWRVVGAWFGPEGRLIVEMETEE